MFNKNKTSEKGPMLEFYTIDYYSNDGCLYKSAYCGTKMGAEMFIITKGIYRYIVKKWVDKGDYVEISEYTDIAHIK